MAWTQNQSKRNISNNLNPVSKTPEHKRTLYIPDDRSGTLNYVYFVVLFCIFVL